MGSRTQSPNPELQLPRPPKVVRFLANLTLVAALIPYASPMPVKAMDAQLTGLIVSTLAIIFLSIFASRFISLNSRDLTVLGAGILVLFYIDLGKVPLNVQWIRTCGTMLLGFPVYLAVRNLYPYMSPKVLTRVVGLYFAVLIFQITMPYYYLAVFKRFLSEVRWEPGSVRGPNGLCVEPSMLGNMCVLFVVSMYFFHREYWKTHRTQVKFIVIASALMLLISQSATGIVLAFIVGFLALLFSKKSFFLKVAVVAALVVAVIIGGLLAGAGSSRGAQFVSSMAKNPAIVLQDPSFALRFVGLFLGIHGLPDAPLGTGELLLDSKLADKAWEGETMRTLWPQSDLRAYIRDYVMERASGIGPMVMRMGFVSFVVFWILLASIDGFKEAWVVRAFLLALLLNTTLFASTIWFVIGGCAALTARIPGMVRLRSRQAPAEATS